MQQRWEKGGGGSKTATLAPLDSLACVGGSPRFSGSITPFTFAIGLCSVHLWPQLNLLSARGEEERWSRIDRSRVAALPYSLENQNRRQQLVKRHYTPPRLCSPRFLIVLPHQLARTTKQNETHSSYMQAFIMRIRECYGFVPITHFSTLYTWTSK